MIWAAGFLEGDGSFRFGKPYSFILSATQKHPEPLERLRVIFGAGSVRVSHKQNGRVYHQWQVLNHPAVVITERVLPFLSPRYAESVRGQLALYNEHKEQMRLKREKPTCNNGHLWSENLGIRKRGIGKGVRYCKACYREAARRKRAAG